MQKASKYFSFPIASVTKSAGDDEDLIIRGRATDATLDHDMQVIDPAWSGPELKRWLSTGGNVRMAHDARRPIGKGISAETDEHGATWVTSVIVDPVAVKLVRRQILTAYSVGIANPKIRPDPMGRATGGIICGGSVVELTVCDRPSNPACGITLVKARADGSAVWVGKAWSMSKSKKSKKSKVSKAVYADPVAYRKWLAKQAGSGGAAVDPVVAMFLDSPDPQVREMVTRGLYL